MQILVAAALVALVLLVLVLGARALRPPSRPSRRGSAPSRLGPDDRAVVMLDLDGIDARSDAARRLVDEVAWRTFQALPDAAVVEVRDRDGVPLGERRREAPREIDIPSALYEPHAPRRVGPEVGRAAPAGPGPGVRRDFGDQPGVPSRPLAERFALPAEVLRALDDPDDAVAIVRAVLEAAGKEVRADGRLLRVDLDAVIVIPAPIGEPVRPEALNVACTEFRDSGARRGVVVTPGYMDPSDLRRREMLMPSLLHAGPAGIQRMADAAALGADPVAFAAAPPMSEVVG